MTKRYALIRLDARAMAKVDREFWRELASDRAADYGRPSRRDVADTLRRMILRYGHETQRLDAIDMPGGLRGGHRLIAVQNRYTPTGVWALVDTLPVLDDHGCYRPTRFDWEQQQRIASGRWPGGDHPWCSVFNTSGLAYIDQVMVDPAKMVTDTAADNLRAAMGYARRTYGEDQTNE